MQASEAFGGRSAFLRGAVAQVILCTFDSDAMQKLLMAVLIVGWTQLLKAQNRPGFETMVSTVLTGTVDTLDSAQLAAMLRRGTVHLLDTRSAEEYAVSHIAGAHYAGYENFDLEQWQHLPKKDTVVVYCSIGKRSEEVGQRMLEAGFTHVLNLYGGIFDWSNKGFPVVNSSGESSTDLHPYNAFWGLWITRLNKRYEPR